jgi:hypothetical protein
MMEGDSSKLRKTENKLMDSYTSAAMSGETAKAETLEPKIVRVQKKVEGLINTMKEHSAEMRKGSKEIKSMATYGYGAPQKGMESHARAPSATPSAAQLQPSSPFLNHMKSLGVQPDQYLKLARKYAKQFGIQGPVLFSDKAGKKLMVRNPSGQTVHFGSVGSGDFLLHSLEGNKQLAEKKRQSYLARALKIKGDWKADKYSPNNLAINVLWAR